ncbi:MAG: hypothetical protein KKB30_05265 [Proteobacteria bacterium]|nr:hypothetical protein [Pseudomonadota bacterium]MBU1714627.1 hypothetical protein [Pseudomonadota bacterium]
MIKQEINNERWQKAYIEQSRDAEVGRLFKGLIHNLNGVAQAFSMQSELFGMFFEQGESLVEKIRSAASDEEKGELLDNLQDMFHRRRVMASQMGESVISMQEIMRRTCAVMEDCREPEAVHPYTLNEVVKSEVEFLKADGFFKHKVEKELRLSENLPPLQRYRTEVHHVLFVLLANALESLLVSDKPRIVIETIFKADNVLLVVEDTGLGVPPAIAEKLFEPFVSGKEGHHGLGLYNAEKIARRFGGSIAFETVEGVTRFTLTIPADRVICGS